MPSLWVILPLLLEKKQKSFNFSHESRRQFCFKSWQSLGMIIFSGSTLWFHDTSHMSFQVSTNCHEEPLIWSSARLLSIDECRKTQEL
ncbi:hypothetical protein GOP47_0022844 [Adiantum capillus-veneris]|uniref:Uncharacterized protein n=1 Tax=Adiantum capillus-veneris TaxID=13818 RepID=A0A9D4Z5X1_ADICA|nr:hypothetical protein GOP47_0022844 [Adiantum capillus-veneris]